MSVSFEINAQPRSDTGKGASRRLRREGLVPGIVYGARQDPQMISVRHNELLQNFQQEAIYSHILTLKMGGAKQQVILKDLQRHPSKPVLQHLDLQRIIADEKIRVQVPFHIEGESSAPGIKQGGMVSRNLSDVEVACLPKHLPEFIEIDISALGIGDDIHLSEIILPEGVEIPALAAEGAEDPVVVTIHSGQMAMEEEEIEEEEAGLPEEGTEGAAEED